MDSNGSSMSISQPVIPIFKGECYEFWSIKMKSLFKSQDPWLGGEWICWSRWGKLIEGKLKERFHGTIIHSTDLALRLFFEELQQQPLQSRLGQYCKMSFKAQQK